MEPASQLRHTELCSRALESAPVAILWLDGAGQPVFANAQACQSFGFSETALSSLKTSAIIPDLDDARIQGLWAAARDHGSATLECHAIDGDGRTVPVDIRASLIGEGAEQLLCLYMRDIVARDDAERLLQLVAETTSAHSGREFFRSLARSLADALDVQIAFITECMDHPTTRVRTLARWRYDGFAEDIEYPLAGTPCESVISTGDACLYPSRVEELFPLEQGKGLSSYLGVPIFDGDNSRVIGHLAFFGVQEMPHDFYHRAVFDIFCSRASSELERLQTMRLLRKQGDEYRLLVENQQELVARVDAQGRFEFVSPSLCDLFGGDQQSWLAEPFFRLVGEADRNGALAAWETLGAPPHDAEFEHCAETSAGRRWLAWSHKASLDDAGNVRKVVCVGRDVTSQREAEEHARETLRELAHLSRVNSMGEMASAFAHELNQPLCAILNYAKACMRVLEKEGGGHRDVINAMERVAANAELAGDVIRQMRGFVRKEEPVRNTVPIARILEETLTLATVEDRERRIAVTLHCELGLPPVTVNSTQLQQVLINLIRNAREAIGTAAKSGTIIVDARRFSPGKLQVSVRDSGPGLAEEVRGKLFAPFVTSKPGGMGIGLSLCKSIVEAHGGRITAEDRADGEPGACFQFTLPLDGEGRDVG